MGKLTVEEIKKMAGLAIEALEDKKAEDICRNMRMHLFLYHMIFHFLTV